MKKATASTTQPPATQPRRRAGAPKGNRNAVGHGAPKGNRNGVGNKGGGRKPRGAEPCNIKINIAITATQSKKLTDAAAKIGVKYTDFLRALIDQLPT